MRRRSFIKLTALTGASVSAASCGVPEEQLLRFLPDEELTPGVAQLKPSICPLCPSGCGVTVRVMDADVEIERDGQRGVVRRGVAKKLEGNQRHPVNQGGLCARGQAAIQVTYHPDRVTQPLRRVGPRGEGRFEPVSWEDATAELLQQLDGLASSGRQQQLAFITRPVTGARSRLVEDFVEAFGAPPPTRFELLGEDVTRRANSLSFGRPQLPTFDLAEARYVLNFGADFLGTWNSPVAHGVAYGRMRQGRPGVRGILVQIEARMTLTGANADEWLPARPGTEGVLALGLARVIMAEGLRPPSDAGRAGALIDGWASGLGDYTTDRVEMTTGVSARQVERLARNFATLGPAVAMAGGPPLAHTNGMFTALAINALNALVGSVNTPGGILFTPSIPGLPVAGLSAAERPSRSVDQLAAEILADTSAVQVLMIDGADPVFGSPATWRVREALERVPFMASFGSFLDDTSVLADLVLPDHSFLESWVDAVPESGSAVAVVGVAPPAMAPLHDTRAMPDVLLELAGRLNRPLPLPWSTFEEMLRATYGSLPLPGTSGDAWTTALEQGVWQGEPSSAPATTPLSDDTAPAAPYTFAEPEYDGDQGEYPYHFLPSASQAFLDGSLAHLPWLQELPDPITTAMWSSWVEINPTTAREHGIGPLDIVEITSRHGTVRAAAVLSPGLAPTIIAMPIGQGHGTFTRYASGRGANPVSILAPVAEPETGSLAWASTRVQIARSGDPDGRLILFAGALSEYPHLDGTR